MRNGVTEQELIEKAKAKGGERVTLEAIEKAIVSENYFTAEDGDDGAELNRRLEAAKEPLSVDPRWLQKTRRYGEPHSPLSLLTICVLSLWNGYTILGKSSCADPKNFDPELGKRLARTDAVNQIWPLMSYELKSRMARDEKLLEGTLKPMEGFASYIGTKAVNARYMTRFEYNQLRGWQVPADEDGGDAGYIVEYADPRDQPNTPIFQGYVSWSPKDVFERAYRPVRQAERSEATTAEGAGTASGE